MSYKEYRRSNRTGAFIDDANPIPGPSPDYERTLTPTGSRWNPSRWNRWTKIRALAGFIVCVVVLIVIVVVAVVETRKNAYPNYSQLSYQLQDTYEGTLFFDNFDYFTGYDPSSGFVHYVDQAGSTQMNLTYASSTSAVLRVDTSETDASTGRKSVRIQSKRTYSSGLFLLDILHTPYGCGTWPAVWLTDPSNWPLHGEIDVVEAMNQASTGNQMTLHTTDGCDMSVKREMTGTALSTNCLNSTDDNAGCGVQGPEDTYGKALNDIGGGVYAMELREAGIRTWFFPRASIPSDISNDNSTPDPSSWGTALADFPSTDCDIASHFTNQSIIANIDICGSAGSTSVYNTLDNCPGTCTDFAATNASAFSNAYFEFKSFKTYQATS
ncbi:hypothetical protein MMC13_004413 [Lambiella insularis]|nr:hypothetical protein [Lambiella insularis]